MAIPVIIDHFFDDCLVISRLLLNKIDISHTFYMFNQPNHQQITFFRERLRIFSASFYLFRIRQDSYR
jgi:hypothetical protein